MKYKIILNYKLNLTNWVRSYPSVTSTLTLGI